jgi:hypothetical protein
MDMIENRTFDEIQLGETASLVRDLDSLLWSEQTWKLTWLVAHS